MFREGENELETKDKKIDTKMMKKYLESRTKRNKRKLERCVKKYKKVDREYIEYVEKLMEQDSEEWKTNKVRESTIKSKAYVAILVGCILLLVALCINIYYASKTLETTQKIVLDAVTNIINIVISMVVGIGVSTIVLDFFSYVQYTRERLKEIIVDKSFIRKLSDEEKRGIIFKTEESLYFKDGKISPNSLYADVKKKITPLLDACYFSDFSMTICCDIDKNNGIIKKEILKNMKIISNEDNAEFKLPYSVYLRKKDCEEIEQAYDVVSCLFQGKDITSSFKEKQEKSEIKRNIGTVNVDNIRYKENYTFVLEKGENEIEVRTITQVPINDNTYAHTISLPCMKYKTTFVMNTEGYTVNGYGFALEDYTKERQKRNVNYSRIGKSLTIRIDEWALPGEGSMFIINSDPN